MADEPSMDEILASLEQLLNEGEGRNDEPTETLGQTASKGPSKQTTGKTTGKATRKGTGKAGGIAADKPIEEPVKESIEAPAPGFFTALDHAVSEPYNEAGGDESRAAAGASQADPPPARKAATAEAKRAAESQVGMKRIVLTDAMLVKDVQQSLPLDMGETARVAPKSIGQAAGATGKSAVSERAGWNERDIQALVDQVTDDVCSAMSEQLPEMIRKALAHRLSAYIDERMRHQDSEPEE
jgi:hypothetical protein